MAYGLLNPLLMGAPQRFQGGLLDGDVPSTDSLFGRDPSMDLPMGGGRRPGIYPPAPSASRSGGFLDGLFGGGGGEPNLALMALGQGIAGGDVAGSFGQYAPIMAKGRERNATKKWLMNKGMSPEDADIYASNPSLLSEALQGKKRNLVNVGDGNLYDADSGEWITAPNSGEGKPTDDIKEYQFAVKNGAFKGSFTDWQQKGIREQDPTFGREKDLRQEYDMLPEVKDYKIVRSNYERIRQGVQLGTGAGDTAIVFGFMKMLDPTSVVREGEQASAQNAAGVPEGIRGMWNMLIGGGKLSDEARAQILAASDKVYNEASQNIETVNQRYGGIAGQYNLDPSRVTSPTEKYQPLLPPGVTIERVGD